MTSLDDYTPEIRFSTGAPLVCREFKKLCYDVR